MTILSTAEWFDLGCGCEASTLGHAIVRPSCRAHSALIPPEEQGGPTATMRRQNVPYGPVDLELPRSLRGGDARRSPVAMKGPGSPGR